jgi:hypothetical protein
LSRILFKKSVLKELNILFPKLSFVIILFWTTKRLLFDSRMGWRFSSSPERSEQVCLPQTPIEWVLQGFSPDTKQPERKPERCK